MSAWSKWVLRIFYTVVFVILLRGFVSLILLFCCIYLFFLELCSLKLSLLFPKDKFFLPWRYLCVVDNNCWGKMFHDLERNFLVLLAYLYHWYVQEVFKLLEIAAIVLIGKNFLTMPSKHHVLFSFVFFNPLHYFAIVLYSFNSLIIISIRYY